MHTHSPTSDQELFTTCVHVLYDSASQCQKLIQSALFNPEFCFELDTIYSDYSRLSHIWTTLFLPESLITQWRGKMDNLIRIETRSAHLFGFFDLKYLVG